MIMNTLTGEWRISVLNIQKVQQPTMNCNEIYWKWLLLQHLSNIQILIRILFTGILVSGKVKYNFHFPYLITHIEIKSDY